MSEQIKTPDEWCAELGARVMDADGWRGSSGRDWSDPISREEFDRRLMTCTIDGRGYPMFYGATPAPTPAHPSEEADRG